MYSRAAQILSTVGIDVYGVNVVCCVCNTLIACSTLLYALFERHDYMSWERSVIEVCHVDNVWNFICVSLHKYYIYVSALVLKYAFVKVYTHTLTHSANNQACMTRARALI